jgi:hypothetical protein
MKVKGSKTMSAIASSPKVFSVYGSTRGYGANTKNTVTIPDSLRILKDGEAPPVGNIVLKVCTPEAGDERIAFNPYRIQEVAEAKRLFNELIAKGYYAYRIDPDKGGRSGELVRRFEDIIHDGEVMMSEIRPEPKIPESLPMRQAVGAEVVMHPRPVGG